MEEEQELCPMEGAVPLEDENEEEKQLFDSVKGAVCQFMSMLICERQDTAPLGLFTEQCEVAFAGSASLSGSRRVLRARSANSILSLIRHLGFGGSDVNVKFVDFQLISSPVSGMQHPDSLGMLLINCSGDVNIPQRPPAESHERRKHSVFTWTKSIFHMSAVAISEVSSSKIRIANASFCLLDTDIPLNLKYTTTTTPEIAQATAISNYRSPVPTPSPSTNVRVSVPPASHMAAIRVAETESPYSPLNFHFGTVSQLPEVEGESLLVSSALCHAEWLSKTTTSPASQRSVVKSPVTDVPVCQSPAEVEDAGDANIFITAGRHSAGTEGNGSRTPSRFLVNPMPSEPSSRENDPKTYGGHEDWPAISSSPVSKPEAAPSEHRVFASRNWNKTDFDVSLVGFGTYSDETHSAVAKDNNLHFPMGESGSTGADMHFTDPTSPVGRFSADSSDEAAAILRSLNANGETAAATFARGAASQVSRDVQRRSGFVSRSPIGSAVGMGGLQAFGADRELASHKSPSAAERQPLRQYHHPHHFREFALQYGTHTPHALPPSPTTQDPQSFTNDFPKPQTVLNRPLSRPTFGGWRGGGWTRPQGRPFASYSQSASSRPLS